MDIFSSLYQKISAVITADIKFEDESKQFCVMMRIYHLIMLCYFLCFEMLALIFWKGHNLFLVLPWAVLAIIGFVTTYYFRTQIVFHIFSAFNIVWIFLFVRYLGWDAGAQHFLFPLLIVSFFATYGNFRGKLTYTLILLAFRLYLYLFVRVMTPVYPIPADTQAIFQILNMITLFSIMFYVCWTFSSTNQAAEEKLAFYNKRLKEEARTDALTGLWNRRSMLEFLESRIGTDSQEFLSIAIGDIDFFKKVNDTRGHNSGDAVLVELAKLFRSYMAEHGYVCRWGGEEFFFAFSENGDVAHFCIEELRKKIEKLRITDPATGEEFSVTMTFGVEEYDFAASLTELIKRADDKLYDGKDRGRNRSVY